MAISPCEIHDIALKAAETDAAKRALVTFGKPFGLELYRGGKTAALHKPLPASQAEAVPVPTDGRVGFHPDDMTPIPRPSRYYGRRQNQIAEHFRSERRQAERNPAPPLVPAAPDLLPARIDKSALTIVEPKRLRDKARLKFVASEPCLVCGRQPSDPHHLRFAQPRALGMKVSRRVYRPALPWPSSPIAPSRQ
jgi:Rad52/22 family double-strand break repair protein